MPYRDLQRLKLPEEMQSIWPTGSLFTNFVDIRKGLAKCSSQFENINSVIIEWNLKVLPPQALMGLQQANLK